MQKTQFFRATGTSREIGNSLHHLAHSQTTFHISCLKNKNLAGRSLTAGYLTPPDIIHSSYETPSISAVPRGKR